MSSFLLDNDPASPTYGDLKVVNNSLQFTKGRDAIRQHIDEKLSIFLGEWKFDLSLGIPYYRDVFVKNPNFLIIEDDFKAYILDTPGVLALNSFNIDFDSPKRHATIKFQAATNDGNIDFTKIVKI